MIMSRRAKRMERHHKRTGRAGGINLVSLMDIFTILVFFLLVNSSDGEVLPTTKSVALPESVADEKPRQTVVVMVTDSDILVQGQSVATVSQLLDEGQGASEQLQRALEQQRQRGVRISDDTDPSRREVTIMGNRDIPYRLLKEVMASCTRAGYGRLSLAVLQKPLQDG